MRVGGGRPLVGLWPWLTPVVVFLVAVTQPDRLAAITAVLAGAVLVGIVVRHPVGATLALIVALPFDLYGMAAMYRLGLPATLLRPLRFWPEAILAGLALVALDGYRQGRYRLDALDLAALGYVAVGTVYLLVPRLFVTAPVGTDIGFYARELGWRTDVMYVVAFLVARRLPFREELAGRALRVVVAVGTVVAALGLFEFAAPGVWDQLAAGTLRVPTYQLDVLRALPLDTSLHTVEVFGSIGGHRLVRVGSVLDYESLGFYLALCLAGAAGLLARGRAPRWVPGAFVVLAVGLFVTQTRSGILAGAIAVALALRPRHGADPVARRRLIAAFAVVAVVGGGLLVAGHVGTRLAGDRVSNSAHSAEIHQGFQALFTYPLGRGLATAGPQYKRSALSAAGLTHYYAGPATGIAVTDDQWLAVGTELGLAGLAVFIAMCLLMVRELSRRPLHGLALAPATRNALIGILIGGTFLQPFINQAVSLTVFLLIGVASGVASVPGTRARTSAPTAPVAVPSGSVSAR